MKRISFCENWKYRVLGEDHAKKDEYKGITLPFDAARFMGRDEHAFNGSRKGYYRNGRYEFVKIFSLDEVGSENAVYLEFEGIYHNAFVYLNGSFLSNHPNGYTSFVLDITKHLVKGNNYLKVICDTSDDSRWYTGAGPYRDVNIYFGDKSGHFMVNGLKVRTIEASKEKAIIGVRSSTSQEGNVSYEVRLGDEVVATSSQNSKDECLVAINNPTLWSVENPTVYRIVATIDNDEASASFGIRTIEVDSKNGLQVNGENVKLRGTCVHHDNGILGAMSIKDAEYRKVKALKQAGFNAVRTSHNPASRYFLDACDELGMIVFTEAFDVWHNPKCPDDYSKSFDKYWKDDLEAMVDMSYNHPSVMFYSVGNEVADLFNHEGVVVEEMLVSYLKTLDPTRYVSNAINGIMLAIQAMEVQGALMGVDLTGGGDVNNTMNAMRDRMTQFHRGDGMSKLLDDISSCLDVVGYNYMPERYDLDESLNPNRVIVGTESYAREIPTIWNYVKNHSNVLGDFCWIGLDYLGEAGIGKVGYEKEDYNLGIYGKYPYLTSASGDISITLERLPASYFREIVFGLRKEPYIAVHRPRKDNAEPFYSLWSFYDVVSSWTFNGFEGDNVKIDVYSNSKSVKLYINEQFVGEEKIENNTASFEAAYTPGIIKAVDSEGNEFFIKTHSDNYGLSINVEGESLKFVDISVKDEEGNLVQDEDDEVTLDVKNGELIAFGNGDPKQTEDFVSNKHALFMGKSLAILKTTEECELRVFYRDQVKVVTL